MKYIFLQLKYTLLAFFIFISPVVQSASYSPAVSAFLLDVRSQSPAGYFVLSQFSDYTRSVCDNRIISVDFLKKFVLYSDLYINLLAVLGANSGASQFEHYMNSISCNSILEINAMVILEEDKNHFR